MTNFKISYVLCKPYISSERRFYKRYSEELVVEQEADRFTEEQLDLMVCDDFVKIPVLERIQ